MADFDKQEDTILPGKCLAWLCCLRLGSDPTPLSASPTFTDAVTDEDVANVVSRHTGIPVSKLLMGEREKLLHMEAELSKRVVGQAEAVKVISDCVRVARAGLHEHKKPIGCFLFLGPSGVGKTELGKALAEFMFQDESAMVRIDMSEVSTSSTPYQPSLKPLAAYACVVLCV